RCMQEVKAMRVEQFMIPCDFGGRKAPFPIYVGEPKTDAHPLHYQAWWLSTERGGSIPQEVMDSFEKLHRIALENNVSFAELCAYAIGEASAQEAAAPPLPPSAQQRVAAPQESKVAQLEVERSEEHELQPNQG